MEKNSVLISNFHLIIISHLPLRVPWPHTHTLIHQRIISIQESAKEPPDEKKTQIRFLVVWCVKQRAHDRCANYWWNFNEKNSKMKWKKSSIDVSTTNWRVDFCSWSNYFHIDFVEMQLSERVNICSGTKEKPKATRRQTSVAGSSRTQIDWWNDANSKLRKLKRRCHTHKHIWEENVNRRTENERTKLM